MTIFARAKPYLITAAVSVMTTLLLNTLANRSASVRMLTTRINTGL
ncbi:MAG TPA: hypothetical protein VFX47_02935 [Gammaproteobacteria bacterium]|nr:hypothetical protein [Gammaproteobacteria bacterium]